MPSREAIVKTVFESLETVMRVSSDHLREDTKLISDLAMESIDTIDLLFEVERRLKMSVNLSDVIQRQQREHLSGGQFDIKVRELVNYIYEANPL